jgi:hypothetical protein
MFKAALAQDPACAMCAWGVAWQLGPNINSTGRAQVAEALRYLDLAWRQSDVVSVALAGYGQQHLLKVGNVCHSGAAEEFSGQRIGGEGRSDWRRYVRPQPSHGRLGRRHLRGAVLVQQVGVNHRRRRRSDGVALYLGEHRKQLTAGNISGKRERLPVTGRRRLMTANQEPSSEAKHRQQDRDRNRRVQMAA